MNLREIQLSSRSMIPVALAIPINRDPSDRAEQARERERRSNAEQASANGPAYFFQL